MMHPIGVIRRGEQRFVRDRLGAYGLMPVDGVSLRIIHELGTCNQDALCARLEIDKGRVAKLLARLEDMGLVRRTVNEKNKREKRVVLTEAGCAALEQVERAFRAWNEISTAGFTPEEREQYFAYLTRIAENIIRYRKEGWPQEADSGQAEQSNG